MIYGRYLFSMDTVTTNIGRVTSLAEREKNVLLASSELKKVILFDYMPPVLSRAAVLYLEIAENALD